jgi:hypothetical protein
LFQNKQKETQMNFWKAIVKLDTGETQEVCVHTNAWLPNEITLALREYGNLEDTDTVSLDRTQECCKRFHKGFRRQFSLGTLH